MNRKFYILFVLLGTLLLNNVHAQNIAKDDIAVCFFLVNFSNELGIETDKALNDTIYSELSKQLSQTAEINLHPASYLKGKVPYDFLGYPLASAKKAAKTKASKNYVNVVFDLNSAGWVSTTTNSTSVLGLGKEKNKVKCKLKLTATVTIYDENAKKLTKVKSDSVSDSEVLIESESFRISLWARTEFKPNENNAEIVQTLITRVIEDVAKQLKK